MTGVTREDSAGEGVMLGGKVAKGHRKEEERSPSWDRCDPCRESGASPMSGTVKKHHHKHSIKHRYRLLETLGRGTYGKVKRAVDKSTGMMVAVKSIQKDKITDELDRVHLQQEIEITALLKHQHIIQVFEVFESTDKIIIVMEYASNGELYDFINNKHQLPESDARSLFRQIVSAVHYCHKNGIVHRDIKLENILLDENLNVKLADFGLSNLYHKNQVLETYCGSPLYASPEIVKGLPYHGPEVDCWALGVLLYALSYGSMPFDNSNYKTLAEHIGSGLYRTPPHLSGACGLIDWMLTVNPARRATIEDIANHWWVNWGYDTVVCDCDLLPECQSPLLARYIECQNTQSFKGAQKEHCSSQQREDDEYEGCLRKSKKENDINHSQQEPELIVPRQKPKGILKKRSSFDSSFLNSAFSENLSENQLERSREAQTTTAYESHKSVNIECSFNMPKKGILKKTYEMESGYSSSPERLTTSEIQKTYLTVPQEKTKSDKHSKRKKGILKKNGRFSTSLDLPGDCSALQLSDSMGDLLIPNEDPPKSPSRPSSVISDDSFLSSDSFDLLDMTYDTKSQLFSYISRNNFYSSEEQDLLTNKLMETVCSRDRKL